MDRLCAEITPLCAKQSTVKVLERSFVGAHEKSSMLQPTTVTYCAQLSLPPPPLEIFYDTVSVLTRLPKKKLLQEPDFFWTISLLFHFIISLCIVPISVSISSLSEKPLFFFSPCSLFCPSLQCET